MRGIRKLAGVFCIASIAACGAAPNLERGIISAIGEPTDQYDKSGGRDPRFTALFNQPQAYALQAILVSSGVRGGFLRESTRGSIDTWLGTDGVTLTLDRGIIVGTRGLGAGMLGSDVSDSAALIHGGGSGIVQRIHTFLDGNDRAAPQPLGCRITQQGRAVSRLDTGPVNTRLVSEVCEGTGVRFENLYWVDDRRGRIVQSRQWTGPLFGQIDLQVVYNFR